jgi:hypothetical protein
MSTAALQITAGAAGSVQRLWFSNRIGHLYQGEALLDGALTALSVPLPVGRLAATVRVARLQAGAATSPPKVWLQQLGAVGDLRRTSSTFSVGPTHLSGAEIQELMLRSDMKLVGANGAGAARPPRHHIFVQEQREWFAARGVDIDRYTLELSWGDHSAIHTGGAADGWNARVRQFIDDEKLLRREYTRREVLKFGAELRREFGLGNVKVVPYER